jgi:hypothetical protein
MSQNPTNPGLKSGGAGDAWVALYEDNHLIAVNKQAGEIVQGDKTGDMPLSEKIKNFIKERDAKPGNVFIPPLNGALPRAAHSVECFRTALPRHGL